MKMNDENIKKIADNLPFGLGVFFVDGGNYEPVIINTAFVELFDIDIAAVQRKKELAELVLSESVRHEKIRFDRSGAGDFRWYRIDARRLEIEGREISVVCVSDVTEETEAAVEQQKMRTMYEAAVSDTGIVVWEYDIAAHRVIMADNEFTRYDYSKFDLAKVIENAPYSLASKIADADVEKFLGIYRAVDGGAPEASCEVWYKLTPGQEPRCEQIRLFTVFGDDGEPVSALGIGRNITEQKLAEKKYELAYKELEEAHPMSLGSFHLNLTTNWCGNGKSPLGFVLKQQEKGTADSYFQEFAKLIADEDVREKYFKIFTREALLRQFENGVTNVSIEYPIEYEDGTRHWRSGLLFMLRNPITGDIEAVTYAIDIDDRKRNELIMEKLTGSSFEYIALIDPKHNLFKLCNKKNGDLCGSVGEKSDYAGFIDFVKTNYERQDGEEPYENALAADKIAGRLEEEGPFTLVYDGAGPDRSRHIQLKFSWLEKPGGLILVMQSDITEAFEEQQKRLAQVQEALLREAKANEAKSVFLSSMSHDLRTPLNGIIGFIDFAIREEDPQKRMDYLLKVRSSSELLHDLINDTLELSRIESGKVSIECEAVPAREITPAVITALRPAAEMKGVEIEMNLLSSPDTLLWVDKLKMQKIVLNLVSNAVKYTHQGGRVRVSVIKLDPPENGCNQRLIVEDTGIGMSSEFLGRIFEPFAQEKRSEALSVEGTGLGLTIVKRYVDLMKGRITVQSKVHEGTKFMIDLPVKYAADRELIKESKAADEAVLKGKNVLLCEDNLVNTEIAVLLLKEKGLNAECAENGRIGLEKFEQSETGYYDIVLMDIRMPVMDGLETAAAIRKLSREDAGTVPVVAMTADAFEESRIAAAEAGMNGYVTKPIDPENLYRTIAEVLS
ncbi:MAG: ATP-binding protein [Eubacteriaceae bacterium]|jgi:signal transduction histidine kinase/CheY-like chemotaxis protein/PAS domain-containing protein|nr:ATP-binding protein [Eubacteriaceae bacterium]